MPIAVTKTRFVLSATLPVVVLEVSLLPFWLAGGASHSVALPFAQIVLTSIILPLYLGAYGSWSLWRGSRIPFTLAMLLISALLAVLLDYSVWGMSSGRFFAPDADTLVITASVARAAVIITVVPPVVVLVVRSIYRRLHGGT